MINVTAYSFVEQARFHAEKQRYKIAFDFYVKAVQLDPRIKEAVEFEFRALLTKFNLYLAYDNNRAQIYSNFILAMQLYPGNTNLLCGIGKYLMKNALYAEALCHFEKALLIDANLVDMEKNFDSAKRFLFSRNNFRYLNDAKRKDAYLLALHANEQNNSLVGHSSHSAPKNVLAKVSDCIVGRSNIHDILIMDKQKGQLEIRDLFGDKTLFMMNRFGPGLFRDQLLETIQKAFEAKLLDGRRVLPGRAEYYVVGAKCKRINTRYQLSTAAKELLGIPFYIVHVHYTSESYHGKDLKTYDDLEYVTEHKEIFKIDFNNYTDVVEKLISTEPHTAFLKSNKDSDVDVLVGYFNLHLMEGVTLTTDPRSPDCTDAWPQAVFFDFVPRSVKENENVCVQFLTYEGKLKLMSDSRRRISRLSSSTISFLNDSEYVNAIIDSIGLATIHLTQICDISQIDIADMSPFPIFGMYMLKRGARSLVCHARQRHDKEFIERVFRRNEIPQSKVTILSTSQWNIIDKKFHAIVYNALELSGDIDVRMCQVLYHLRYSHLVDCGLTFPANVKLIGQLISSDRLDTLNKVKEDGPMSPMADHVNMFQASQAHCLDPFRLEHETLSDPVVISSCCHHMGPETITVPVARDGVCNAILCWYEINMINDGDCISTYRKGSYVDTTAFLIKTPVQVHRGDTVSVLRCVDYNGSFKLALDLDVL